MELYIQTMLENGEGAVLEVERLGVKVSKGCSALF